MSQDPARQIGSPMQESTALHLEVRRVYEQVRALVTTGQLQPEVLQEAFNLHEAASRLDKVLVQATGAAQYARSGGIDVSDTVSAACNLLLAALRSVRDQARFLAIQHKL